MLSQLAKNRVDRAVKALEEARDQCASDAYRSMAPKNSPTRRAAAKLDKALSLLETL
jgi:hypothetical protein